MNDLKKDDVLQLEDVGDTLVSRLTLHQSLLDTT